MNGAQWWALPEGFSTEPQLLTYRDHKGCSRGSVALILAEKDSEDGAVALGAITVSGPSYRPASDQRSVEYVSVPGGRG